MKRWQVEQIFYLNDFGKRKLALPESHHIELRTGRSDLIKRESIILTSLRRFCNFFLKVL